MDSDCALPRAHVPPVTIWYLHDDGVPSEPLAISLRKFRIVEPKCVRTQNHGNMVHPHRVGVGIARLDCHSEPFRLVFPCSEDAVTHLAKTKSTTPAHERFQASNHSRRAFSSSFWIFTFHSGYRWSSSFLGPCCVIPLRFFFVGCLSFSIQPCTILIL